MNKILSGFKCLWLASIWWIELLGQDCSAPRISDDFPPDWEGAFKEIDRHQAATHTKWVFFHLINCPLREDRRWI